MSHAAEVVDRLRRNGRHIAIEVLVNIILPLLIYRSTRTQLGEVHALMASSAAPIAWSIITFIRQRTIDAVSLLVLAGIALSLLAYAGGGSVRMLQLREKLVTGVIGLVFLGSAAIGRPLIYQLARSTIARQRPDELADFEARRNMPAFKRVMLTMTLVWGFGLLGEAAFAGFLVFQLSVQQFLAVGPIIGYGTIGALSLWTAWYARRLRRRREAAERAAAAAAATETVG